MPVAGKQIYGGSTQELLARLDKQNRIELGEVYNWITHQLQGQVQLSNAQQNVMNGLHVMKIPIGHNAALYFTKERSQLKAWAYKWLDKQPGAKLFSGYILSYSFQDSLLTGLTYAKESQSMLKTQSFKGQS